MYCIPSFLIVNRLNRFLSNDFILLFSTRLREMQAMKLCIIHTKDQYNFSNLHFQFSLVTILISIGIHVHHFRDFKSNKSRWIFNFIKNIRTFNQNPDKNTNKCGQRSEASKMNFHFNRIWILTKIMKLVLCLFFGSVVYISNCWKDISSKVVLCTKSKKFLLS